MSAWDELVGQEPAVEILQRAARAAEDRLSGGSGAGMTHAWLFTGPPGSGRSNAARAFAQALQTPPGGEPELHHPDIAVVRTDRLSLEVDEIREVVRSSALRPTRGRWQILIVEDADRLTEKAADAMLKALEEPSERTIWLLCAPTPEDVIVTIRSRSRQVVLRTPPVAAVAGLLRDRDGVDPERAEAAARASQGHIGRARALATREETRRRRDEVLDIPVRLRNLGHALDAAALLQKSAAADAEARGADLDARELSDFRVSWGVEERGRRPAGYAGQLSALEKDQKRRRTRMSRDALDGALIELLAFYRDVLAVQVCETADLVNVDRAGDVGTLASAGSPEDTVRWMDAITECRAALGANAAPLLALESMMERLTW